MAQEPLRAICTLEDYRDAEGDGRIQQELKQLESQLSAAAQELEQGGAKQQDKRTAKQEAKREAKLSEHQEKLRAR